MIEVRPNDGPYGNSIIVFSECNGQRLAIRYAHFDSFAPGLASGQVIQQGSPIGETGATGNTYDVDAEGNIIYGNAPHLHYEFVGGTCNSNNPDPLEGLLPAYP